MPRRRIQRSLSHVAQRSTLACLEGKAWTTQRWEEWWKGTRTPSNLGGLEREGRGGGGGGGGRGDRERVGLDLEVKGTGERKMTTSKRCNLSQSYEPYYTSINMFIPVL